MILDTTFFIDLLRNDKKASQKAAELEDPATTSISVFELWRGFGALSQDKREKVYEMLDQIDIFLLDTESAKIGGSIAQNLDKKGQEIDAEDCMIAGIVLNNKQEILTRNTKHFKRIPGLHVHEY